MAEKTKKFPYTLDWIAAMTTSFNSFAATSSFNQQPQPPMRTSPTTVSSLPNFSPTAFPSAKKPRSVRFWASITVVVLAVIGLLAALLLINLNQDVRQQASVVYGNDCVLDCQQSGETRAYCVAQCSEPDAPETRPPAPTETPIIAFPTIVNCCINNQITRIDSAACQAEGGVVGVCPTASNVCATALGNVFYGRSIDSACNAQGIKTVISCSSTGVVNSSTTREGCDQPLPSPTPLGCYSRIDGCLQAAPHYCNGTPNYTSQTQCLATLNTNCNPTTTNCSTTAITVWVPI